MRKILCASALVWALYGSAFAGDIQNPPIAPQTHAVQEQDDAFIIRDDSTDSMTQIELDLLAVIPSLF
jgi:hypothetical protein